MIDSDLFHRDFDQKSIRGVIFQMIGLKGMRPECEIDKDKSSSNKYLLDIVLD